MSQEKRKHIRVEHKGSVHFAAEDRSYQGSSVNISRNGMQVIAELPEPLENIHSINFELPDSGESISIPCRLVRAERCGGDGVKTLGIEFLYEAEAELLLIEQFIHDSASRAAESRLIPRTSCRISDVSAETEGVRILSVDNLSTEGLLLSFAGSLQPGDELTLVLTLRDDPRPLQLHGSVVHVMEDTFRNSRTAGLRLVRMKDTEKSRLRNIILAFSSGSALRGMYDHLNAGAVDAGFRIGESGKVAELLSQLATRRVPLSILLEDDRAFRECLLVELRADGRTFAVRVTDGSNGTEAVPGRSAYVGFSMDGASYHCRTEVAGVEKDLVVLEVPATVLQLDKRSYGRKSLDARSTIRLVIGQPGAERVTVGRLVDISWRGFLCEVDASLANSLSQGDHVRYSVDASLGLDSHGQIRHAELVSTGGSPVLRVGIEAGLARIEIRPARIDAEEWSRGKPFQPGSVELPADTLESIPVSYRDRSDREIRALLNSTGSPVRAPVLVIPPSYGKRKESYAPLVATLLANFKRLGKPLVTLRYDGINRPGESHNDLSNPRRGYEMLSYRISQGMHDLEASLDFVARNPHFEPERIILLTFSMSSLDARRYLSTRREGRVDYWISCMGVPCAQSTLRNILGGIDIIGNLRLNIPNGTMGLLGHLVDTDTLARDAVANRYAFITDARADMARIRTPILWVSGLHDMWVDPEEVIDLMSVRSPGAREVLEIPFGHNLHTSDDAIQTYKIIAEKLYRQLYAGSMEPCDPCKAQMLRLVASERERLQERNGLPMEAYWRGYLLGNERNSRGYDFYRELEEFREFFDEEVALLRPEEGGRIADLGCGTGLVEERILDRLVSSARASGQSRPVHVTAVDLVPEALERTRAKWEGAVQLCSDLRVHQLDCRAMNLEPNRLLPVRRFLDDARLGYGYLQGRVEGLSAETLARIERCEVPEVHGLMRGDSPDADAQTLAARLAAVLPPEDIHAVLDFNRAARFLLRALTSDDLSATPHGEDTASGSDPVGRMPLEPGRYRVLTADAIRFDRLSFGTCDLELRLGLPEAAFDKIVASLFVSYLHNPDEMFQEMFRALKPNGMLVVSSMRPDCDVSSIFTRYVARIRNLEPHGNSDASRSGDLSAAREMLNEAAGLFELEEDGHFRFYSAEELTAAIESAGFVGSQTTNSLGHPAQAVIVAARKPSE